ncbi:MAG TPA: hypothetical protein VKF80_05850 [Candidatus Eisenbacteria bacterium]|nr:hypothetical protein [Candidatus Eisenbacteria bacterium]
MKPSSGPAITVGMATAYALAVLHVLPRLYFYPRVGLWSWSAVAIEPSISWYGYVGWALVGGLAARWISRFVPWRTPWRLALIVPLLVLAGLFWAQHAWFGL